MLDAVSNVFIVGQQRWETSMSRCKFPRILACPAQSWLQTYSLLNTVVSMDCYCGLICPKEYPTKRSQLPEYLSKPGSYPLETAGTSVWCALFTNTGHGPTCHSSDQGTFPPTCKQPQMAAITPAPLVPRPGHRANAAQPLPTDYARLPPSVLMSWANDRQVDTVEKDTARAVQVPSTAIHSPADNLWYLV